MEVFENIIRAIKNGSISNRDELQKAKIKLCKEYKLDKLPSNADILSAVEDIDDVERSDIVDLLRRKPSRSISGVTVVAVMTSPAECPHGKCIMCPGGPEGENPSPQSYTGKEPAALRGARHDYDGKEQVLNRLEQYKSIGHPTDKTDLIIMGGTFPARPWYYQKNFVMGCFEGLNGEPSAELKVAHKKNERAKNRCIGLTVETRPDICGKPELERMLALGVTRVELGVQSVNDDLLNGIQRGHSVDDTITATKLVKDNGLKICYHIMPGLPGSTPENDVDNFKQLFDDQRFRPDMLKIYPTLVVKGTELYDMWKSGDYEPLSTNKAAKLVAQMKTLVPDYVRIQRVQRDIPTPYIDAGVKHSNLRQYAKKYMDELGESCRCIRCREAGRSSIDIDENEIELRVSSYNASFGKEYFLELSDNDILVAYSRLRISDLCIPTIRELRVVGEMTPIDDQSIDLQHQGYGRMMLERCESIAAEKGFKHIRVTSGVGVRGYYRKYGYDLKGWYMLKDLRP